MSKEIAREFRTAAWQNAAEVQEFLTRAVPLATDVLAEMLAFVADRRNAADARAHQVRCAVFAKVIEANPDRELFGHVLRALKLCDPVAGAMLVEAAPKVNNVANHLEMVELFRNRSPEVRAYARALAAKVGGKTAFGALSRLVEASDFPGRIEAIDAMVSMAGYHAVPALKAAIAPATSDEKLRILEFLGSPGFVSKNRDAALEALASLFSDFDANVARGAILAYASLASEEVFLERVQPLLSVSSLTTILVIVQALARFSSPRVLALLREQLQLGPKAVRVRVLETLEEIAIEDVLPTIAEALSHKQIAVRLRAAEALKVLSERGTLDVARTVIWLLRSRDPEVRRIAADVARSVRDTEGQLWPQLLRHLRDEDWWVRERITDALLALAGKQLTRHCAAFLQDESDVVRRYGVEMLMRIQDPASLGALVRAAGSDPDWWVRERAIEAIGALGDPRAIPYIVDFMQKDPDLLLVCVHTLAQIGERSAAPHVAVLMPQADTEQQIEILRCLESLDDSSQASALVPYVEHPDHRVRSKARELLRRWRMDADLGDFTAAVEQGLSPLDRLLFAMAKSNGDDLILHGERRPYIKKMGRAVPLANKTLTADQVRSLLLPHITEAQREQLEANNDVDFSYEVKSEGLRFRVNMFNSQTGLSAVFRIVRNHIPSLEELQLPEVIHSFGDLPHGLVLIGGPTGSGKSTTLAALIDYINRTYAKHIITLEDPIEVIHTPKKSTVNQREMGVHSRSFHHALRSTLREDPDVILVGEMRDLETIAFAISAAETGHLVFGTVHTASADTTVDRLINAFPNATQPQVRSILANSLRAVCCQYLAPRKDGTGRIPAVEIMLNNDAVANLIRKGKTYQIPNLIQMSRELGMRSMDHELARLFRAGIVSSDVAYIRAVNKKDIEAVIADVEGGGNRTAVAVTGDHPPASAPRPDAAEARAPESGEVVRNVGVGIKRPVAPPAGR